MGFKKNCFIAAVVAYVTYQILKNRDVGDLKGVLMNKNVVVTGASSGIGEQMAKYYCSQGTNVVILARREKLLQEVIKSCYKISPRPHGTAKFEYIVADFNDIENSAVVMKKAIDILGSLDYLVLNHAFLLSDSKLVQEWSGTDLQWDTMSKSLNINFLSFAKMVSVALPYLKSSSGSVTAISSFMVEVPGFTLPYATTKAAINTFFTGLRQELIRKDHNVSVTIVHLGLVHVSHTKDSLEAMSAAQGRDVAAEVAVLPVTTAEMAGKDLVHATVSRMADVYYPYNQHLWWLRFIRLLLPRADDNMKVMESCLSCVLKSVKAVTSLVGFN